MHFAIRLIGAAAFAAFAVLLWRSGNAGLSGAFSFVSAVLFIRAFIERRQRHGEMDCVINGERRSIQDLQE
jgi:hypothetical protein